MRRPIGLSVPYRKVDKMDNWNELSPEQIAKCFFVDGKTGKHWWEMTHTDYNKVYQLISKALKEKNK